MRLSRFVPVYGGKRRIAGLYPPPTHNTIIEPFAGGAGYSLEYPDHEVRLVDLDERVVGTWDYLIHATEAEILRIPAEVFNVNEDLPGYGPEVRWLVGYWLQPATKSGPALTASSWSRQAVSRSASQPSDFWGEKCRARLAGQVGAIRHWTIRHGSYEDFEPTAPATWFVDPPYLVMGTGYREGSKALNFEALGAWCKSLPGQVIVCENEGATWLPFEPLCELTGGAKKHRQVEVVWTKNEKNA